MNSGLSTLGIELYVAVSEDGEKVTTASAYSQLHRINEIGELTIDPENIDSSALEDLITQYVQGRSTVSDTYAITFNVVEETITEWKNILGKKVCFMTVIPGLTDAIFVIATVPPKIPIPSLAQNSLLTAVMNCTTNKFIGLDTKVAISGE